MQRYRRTPTQWIIAAIVLVILIAIRYAQDEPDARRDAPAADQPIESGTYEVLRVVDGDTLLLTTRERLRLQGIDTPETKKEGVPIEAWGPEATEYTEEFIREAGKRIRVEFGPERVDQYDRLLGFVWYEDRFLNEELVREGLARATTQYHFSPAMKRRLRKAQDDARSARRGIWSQ